MPSNILVIDDDPVQRRLVEAAVTRFGHSAMTADSGEAGLKMLAAHSGKIAVVILDLVMPGMDGIEVARLAAARHPGLRIMFITGFAAVALAAGESAPPGAKVLSKPIHLREIVSEVERMMAAA